MHPYKLTSEIKQLWKCSDLNSFVHFFYRKYIIVALCTVRQIIVDK